MKKKATLKFFTILLSFCSVTSFAQTAAKKKVSFKPCSSRGVDLKTLGDSTLYYAAVSDTAKSIIRWVRQTEERARVQKELDEQLKLQATIEKVNSDLNVRGISSSSGSETLNAQIAQAIADYTGKLKEIDVNLQILKKELGPQFRGIQRAYNRGGMDAVVKQSDLKKGPDYNCTNDVQTSPRARDDDEDIPA